MVLALATGEGRHQCTKLGRIPTSHTRANDQMIPTWWISGDGSAKVTGNETRPCCHQVALQYIWSTFLVLVLRHVILIVSAVSLIQLSSPEESCTSFPCWFQGIHETRCNFLALSDKCLCHQGHAVVWVDHVLTVPMVEIQNRLTSLF